MSQLYSTYINRIHSCIFWGRLMWQNSTFGSRFLFSIERSRPNFLGNRPRAWKTGILKKRMKTVANKTCFEVPRKNELVHVVKTGFNRLYIMFFKLLHDTCWPRRVFGSLWNGKKIAENLGGNCSSIRTPGRHRILLRFFHASILQITTSNSG